MILPIQFQALTRIEGKEGRSKLIHSDSELYKVLKELKALISAEYTIGADRMDLHIELTKERRDPNFSQKAQSLQGKLLDLSKAENWGYLGRAFVLWTPDMVDYGQTHITLAFFGRNPHPEASVLQELILQYFQQEESV